MHLKWNIPDVIKKFIRIYFTGIIFFTAFRMILFCTETARVDHTVPVKDILLSFVMGFRFDTVIAGYILLLPFVVLAISSFFKSKSKALLYISTYYIIVVFSVAFLISAIDIPYFNQFFARFSVSAFAWLDSPLFVFKMIMQEPRYWLFILPWVLFIYIFIRRVKKILYAPERPLQGKIYVRIIWVIFFTGLMMLGIRGRIDEKSPIRVGTAYFCNNAFLNQLGLNPNFTLIRSYLDSRSPEYKTVKLMDDSVAIANVQKYLNIVSPDKDKPLLRTINYDSSTSVKHNVILVMMESMSAAKMTRHGNTNNLTPFLDSISQKSYYFENTYTAGIHTFNGVYGTLFSYPALFRQQPMRGTSMLKYHSIFSTLKDNGYSTVYFTTHDGQFDNVEGFLKANDCETVITKADYPAEKIKTTLGVPDDYMFEFSIPILNQLHDKNKPFFAAFMTASDHGPLYIPEYFTPKNTEIKKQIVEYADYSLKKLVELSSKQNWFGNTIFVFVADHGAPLDGLYDMSIDYNHSPLIFYAPDIFKENKVISNMAGQIDIYPTIMGLLKLRYDNNTFGIDLFKENRPYIFCSADDKYGVLDKDWFLIVKTDRSKGLYKYKEKDTHNYAAERPDIVEKMNVYAQSNMQACQYVIRTNKQ